MLKKRHKKIPFTKFNACPSANCLLAFNRIMLYA